MQFVWPAPKAGAKIRRMATYIYSECEIESIIDATKRFRLRFCAVAALILAAACIVALVRPEWIFGVREHARVWVVCALSVFFAGPLVDNLWRWKSRTVKLEESLRKRRVEVSAGGISLHGSASVRRLERSEIQRAEEVSWGLYLRSPNRYRWILIPAQIDGFETVKREVAELGVPIVQAAIPPNWEEFLGVLVFTATMLCAIFSRSASVLAADLLLSTLVAVGGFLIVSANPDNLPKMRWARFGIFLPVAMPASMLWMAVQH
jgi:hypothetical protein